MDSMVLCGINYWLPLHKTLRTVYCVSIKNHWIIIEAVDVLELIKSVCFLARNLFYIFLLPHTDDKGINQDF